MHRVPMQYHFNSLYNGRDGKNAADHPIDVLLAV